MTRLKNVEPKDALPQRDVQDLLEDRGIGRHAPAVTDLLMALVVPLDEPLTSRSEIQVERIGAAIQPHRDRSDGCVLLAAAQVLAARNGGFGVDVTSVTRFLVETYRDIDWTEALRDAFEAVPYGPSELQSSQLVRALLDEGVLDISRFLSSDSIRELTGRRDGDPSLPSYWIDLDPRKTLDGCVEVAWREPIETLGALALALEQSTLVRYHRELYAHFRPITQVLCERWRLERAREDRLLTRCCWSYAGMVLELFPDLLGEDRVLLRELAIAELGRMRAGLRSDPDRAEAFLNANAAYLRCAISFVLRADPASFWDVVRRLLLAFRELPKRSVTLDLRTWDEHGLEEKLPQPWAWLPDRLTWVFEAFLGREMERDPELLALRTNFATFCLSRLKTREKLPKGSAIRDSDLVEPNPIWRQGYIGALRELRVNPGGRGHLTLTWSAASDPNPEVREVATATSEALRRERGALEGSPRRTVYAAFRWLRQAHVSALGDTPDEDGMKRTARKEVRRTRELDEQH